ncbi:MAG TPA: PepSY domain-containing protein [Pyrinomonadaceae bacterium]|nr:PepSY domain-containing protein [Pyrinomonadaceae bacterium]
MKKLKGNMKWMTAVLVAMMIAGAGIALTAAMAQSKRKHESKQEEKAKYTSSVQVQDDKNEREESEEAEGAEENEASEANEAKESKEGNKGEEAEDKAEGAESERLKNLARITPEQASAAALAQVPGTVKKVELENEDGNVVYGVEIKTADGQSDVKVDAGDGRVLHVEKDGEDN